MCEIVSTPKMDTEPLIKCITTKDQERFWSWMKVVVSLLGLHHNRVEQIL